MAVLALSSGRGAVASRLQPTNAHMRFPRLFSPGRIGSMEVRNRIIGSPMERNYCTEEGRVTQRYIDV